jgi:hypothetical protein
MPTGYVQPAILPPSSTLGISPPEVFMRAAPNPFPNTTTIRYRVENTARVTIEVYDAGGTRVRTLVSQEEGAGNYSVILNTSELRPGIYFIKAISNGEIKQSLRIVKN